MSLATQPKPGGGVVLSHTTGTTFNSLLSRYVFAELVPAAADSAGDPRLLLLTLGLGILCPWLGFELVVMLAKDVAQWSLPAWPMRVISLFVVIGGGVDTVRLVLRCYPKILSDDPIVQRISEWRNGRK